jgi:hypothetical protein
VEVHVGDALAYDLVEGEKRPLRPERRRLRRRHPPARAQQRPKQFPRCLRQGAVVGAGYDQGVTVEDGPAVQEGDEVGALEDQMGGKGTRYELIEHAV